MSKETYTPYLGLPLYRAALAAEEASRQQEYKDRKKAQQETFGQVSGVELELPHYFNPSTCAFCIRWQGYEILAEHKPTPPSVEALTVMKIGSASHWAFLKSIQEKLGGYLEVPFVMEEANLSGRVDYLFRNPQTGKWQIWELKFVHEWVAQQVTREGLPDYLMSTKEVYQTKKEQHKQTLLYMRAMREQGYQVECANIFYINRNDGTVKEALVLWDATAEYDAEQLVNQMKEAKARLDKGELPEPSVESEYVCGKLCSYRLNCDYGQRFAAKQEKKQTKRRQTWVYKKTRQQAQERAGQLQKGTLVQDSFFPEEEKKKKKKPATKSRKLPEKPRPKSEPPVCAEFGCRRTQIWEPKAARGGRWVCPEHRE